MHAIRMLVTAEGAPHGHTVSTYQAGEVYSPESEPPATGALMLAFVASKRAVEVDAAGNPVGKPADKRATKAEPAPVADAPADAPDPESAH